MNIQWIAFNYYINGISVMWSSPVSTLIVRNNDNWSHKIQNSHNTMSWYSALPIYRGLFYPDNSWETPITCPLGRGMGVFREILVWRKFYLQI